MSAGIFFHTTNLPVGAEADFKVNRHGGGAGVYETLDIKAGSSLLHVFMSPAQTRKLWELLGEHLAAETPDETSPQETAEAVAQAA